MYWRSSRIQSSKLRVLRPLICHRQVSPGRTLKRRISAASVNRVTSRTGSGREVVREPDGLISLGGRRSFGGPKRSSRLPRPHAAEPRRGSFPEGEVAVKRVCVWLCVGLLVLAAACGPRGGRNVNPMPDFDAMWDFGRPAERAFESARNRASAAFPAPALMI